MTLAALALALSMALVGSLAFADEAEIAKSSETEARGRELVKKAKALFRKGHIQAAYEAFREAWELQPSSEIAANLAATELELGRFRDAAEHLAYALQHPAPGTTPQTLEELQAAQKEATSKIGTLRLTFEPKVVEAKVDGRTMDAKTGGGVVYLDAGEHGLRVEAPGYEPFDETVTLTPGQILEKHIALRQLEARALDPWASTAGASQVVPPTADARRETAPSEADIGTTLSLDHTATALMVGGPIVLAATGAALSFFRGGNAAADDKEELTLACNGPCREEGRAGDEETRDRTATILAVATAGTAALGTTLYLVLARPPRDPNPRGSRSLVPVWIGAGVVLVGTATGIVFLTKASSAEDERASVSRELRSRGGDDPCSEGTPYVRACAAVFGSERERDLNRDLATTAFVTAGVATIGAVAYLLSPRGTDSRPQAGARVRISPSLRGIAIHASF